MDVATTSLQETLSGFQVAADLATESLPSSENLSPPENGISLLDAKNELFLSYLQALALRNLNVIRSLKSGSNAEETRELSDEITRTLCEQRLYLERGVRPLEQRIKYQVDKVIKAADDEERAVAQNAAATELSGNSEDNDSESEDSDEDGTGDSDDGAHQIDELSYRPNPGAFAQPTKAVEADSQRREQMKQDGVYRPPRISATSMPTTETRERKARKPMRSSTIDEYVNNELSTAPTAQPSIGSTIDAGGRRMKSSRQLAQEQERRDYEETNLVRLPKESKKERAKKEGRGRDGGFGGEEWKGLGDSIDRISSLTRKKGKDGALDKSRKRVYTEDGPRGNGDAGSTFELKKRRIERRSRR